MRKVSVSVGIVNVFDVEMRISNRIQIPAIEFEGSKLADASRRRKYTINAIINKQELWTVWDGNELPTFESAGNRVVHIWPHKEFADAFKSKTILQPRVVPIPIDDLIDRVLYESENPIDVAYFPVGLNAEIVIDDAEGFVHVVSAEWERMYGPTGERAEEIQKEIVKNLSGSLKASPKGKLP